jgi:hypothetical protein
MIVAVTRLSPTMQTKPELRGHILKLQLGNEMSKKKSDSIDVIDCKSSRCGVAALAGLPDLPKRVC